MDANELTRIATLADTGDLQIFVCKSDTDEFQDVYLLIYQVQDYGTPQAHTTERVVRVKTGAMSGVCLAIMNAAHTAFGNLPNGKKGYFKKFDLAGSYRLLNTAPKEYDPTRELCKVFNSFHTTNGVIMGFDVYAKNESEFDHWKQFNGAIILPFVNGN